MNKSRTLGQRHSVESNLTWLTWVLFILGAFALALGFLGFMEVPSSDKGWLKIHGAALKTIQLFILNVSPSDLGDIWQTRLASIVAPATTVGAALAAFGGRLALWNLRRRLHLNPAGDLFLGGGRTAAAIAQSDMGRSREKHIRIGIDNTKGALLEETAPDCVVLQADAASPDTLKGINASSAEQVWIVAGDDDRNILILQNLISVDPGHATTRRWFVEISNRDTAQSASTLFEAPENVVIDYFNIERLAARRLMQLFADEILPGLCKGIEEPPILHICVIGSSDLAEAIVLQSIEQLVVSDKPAQCLRLTWIAPDASDCMKELRNRVPALDERLADDPCFAGLLPLAVINAYDLNEKTISPLDWASAQLECPFSTVYIACADELRSTGAMFRVTALRDVLNTPQKKPYSIWVCHWSQGPHHHRAHHAWDDVKHFYVLGEVFKPEERYPGATMDKVAKKINFSWSTKGAIPAAADDIEDVWNPLPASKKWSSRMGADHAKIQRALGAVVDDSIPFGTHIESNQQNEIEKTALRQARLEHRRFLVERLIEGWLPLVDEVSHSGDNSCSSLEYDEQRSLLHLNKTLVPFDKLSTTDKSDLIGNMKGMQAMSAVADSSAPM